MLDSLKWAQLEPGQFDVCYGVVNADPLELSLRSFNVGLTIEAAILPQKFMIGISAAPQSQARWFGAGFDRNSIGASSTDITFSTKGAGSFYQMSVDAEALAGQFPAAPDALDLIDGARGVTLSYDPIYAERLRACLRRIFLTARKNQAATLPHGLSSRIISGTLIPLLSSAIARFDTQTVEPSRCLNRRLAAVRSCEAFMREHVDTTITLLDLSEVSVMRSRSLINAFEAVTGFSPMDYLKRLRLNGVHDALRRRHKMQGRIIDLATDWGFWHMGHFTTDYRAMFGETPSQTLLNP